MTKNSSAETSYLDDPSIVDTSQSCATDGYVQTVSSLGYSKVKVPYHLKDENLYVRVALPCDVLRFSLTFENEQPKPNCGWKKLV